MKTIILLTLFLLITSVKSQSVLTLGSGTSMGVTTGADLCANIINNSGLLYGGGTICGGLVGIEPLASNELPASFDLLQNYPNPFNPVTLIKYQMPKSSYVSIKIYDQLGREVGILFEGDQQAGYYRAVFDGTNFASGIYFCRITASDYSKAIKINLVK